jgi:hypothetical protein
MTASNVLREFSYNISTRYMRHQGYNVQEPTPIELFLNYRIAI